MDAARTLHGRQRQALDDDGDLLWTSAFFFSFGACDQLLGRLLSLARRIRALHQRLSSRHVVVLGPPDDLSAWHQRAAAGPGYHVCLRACRLLLEPSATFIFFQRLRSPPPAFLHGPLPRITPLPERTCSTQTRSERHQRRDQQTRLHARKSGCAMHTTWHRVRHSHRQKHPVTLPSPHSLPVAHAAFSGPCFPWSLGPSRRAGPQRAQRGPSAAPTPRSCPEALGAQSRGQHACAATHPVAAAEAERLLELLAEALHAPLRCCCSSSSCFLVRCVCVCCCLAAETELVVCARRSSAPPLRAGLQTALPAAPWCGPC